MIATINYLLSFTLERNQTLHDFYKKKEMKSKIQDRIRFDL